MARVRDVIQFSFDDEGVTVTRRVYGNGLNGAQQAQKRFTYGPGQKYPAEKIEQELADLGYPRKRGS